MKLPDLRRYRTWLKHLSALGMMGLSLTVFIACAKVGSPYGGPKDEDPPRLLKAEPPDSSLNFVPQKKITLTFDEFIQLENVFEELMLSPPVEGKVIAQIKGKRVVVEFPADIEFRNTTYTLSFGNAIVDNNEGNILENFEYIFSFKDYIDTLSVEGRILNAFDFTYPEERMLVMLYKNLNDSAPLLEKPYYASRTTKNGGFMLHNLESGTYRIFALKDANANMIYDLPDEQIAFSDSLIILNPETFEGDLVVRDSIMYDFLSNADSTMLDTVNVDSILGLTRLYTLFTELLFFTEYNPEQYMTNDSRDRAEQLFFSFHEPLHEPLVIEPLVKYPFDKAWYLPPVDLLNDTLIYWLTDTTMIADDSLVFRVSYHVYDSLLNRELKTDTLVMRYTEPETKPSRGGRNVLQALKGDKDDEVQKDSVKVYLSLKNNMDKPGAFDLNKKIIINTETPLGEIDESRILFFKMKDTIPVPIKFNFHRDTLSYHRFSLNYAPEELTSYRVLIPDSTCTDIYGLANDSLQIAFKTQAIDFYGSLNISVSDVKHPTILQLLDNKDKLVRQVSLSEDRQVNFEYLYPREYVLKVIIDENGNGEWDTGDYLAGRQPEKVQYYQQKLNVRANWEIEVAWPLSGER